MMVGSMRSVGIWGLGKGLPERVMTNQDWEELVDTSDEWIQARTGIKERRIVGADQVTSDLAFEAARAALEDAEVTPEELDLIIVATVTPDMLFPATACLLQDRLGAKKAGAFDLEAGCTGFVYGLVVGQQFIATGAAEKVLVIGAETLSKIMDWEDRATCVLFGDGAGAAVLGPCRTGTGILSSCLGSDGSGGDVLKMPAGGSLHPASAQTVANGMHFLQMNGREVFKFAVRAMKNSAEVACERAGLDLDAIDCYIPHQANSRIITASAGRLGIPIGKVFVNLSDYGNTSSASIPIAMVEAAESNAFGPNDHVLLVGFGAGLTWGALVVKWLDKDDRR